MNLRRTRAVARKEFLHILRDPRSLILALALPLLMLLLFGYALTLDVDRIPTLVYDYDRTPESRELTARFQGSRYFRILGYTDNYEGIERGINKDQCMLGIVIPRNYARDLLSGSEATVQLLLDGSDSNTASIALGYANSVVQAYALELRSRALNRKGGGRIAPPIDGRLRIWYNSELKSKNYIVPGLIGLIMMIIGALLTSLTLAREWEMGTMEQLLSTPLRAPEVALGKMLAYFTLGITDMLITIIAGVTVFQVPMRGSYLLLISTGCVFLVGALLWGIMLSATARSQLIAYQLAMLTSFLPAFLLSGFVFAIESMPLPIQVVTYLFPTRYFVTILKGIFLRGVGLEVLFVEIGLLLAYACIVFFVATRKLRQKVA
ncbi:MAG TPA: ABC transporter permease [Acidobacteriota bacterium]|nr:ABC transporter permease [Acidobacteriota bacterium]